MSPIVYRMNDILSHVVQRVPVGTNLGLLHLLWMLLSDMLLTRARDPRAGRWGWPRRQSGVPGRHSRGKWHATQLLRPGSNSSGKRPFAPTSMGISSGGL